MSAMISITVNGQNKLRILAEQFPDALSEAVDTLKTITVNAVVSRTPRRTGYMASTVQVDELSEYSFTVGPTAPYSLDVVYGTKPHPIVGKPILSWTDPTSGNRVFARNVSHPGTSPNPFLKQARDDVSETAQLLMEQSIRDSIQDIISGE